MRFLTADYLYPLHTPPLKKGVLQISEKGEVIAIFADRNIVPKDKLEFFEGVLCPGFINAHCHLELSHLFREIDQGKGLLNFLSDVRKRDNFDREYILASIEKAEQQMIKHGIVAVGDICNTADTLAQKQKRNLQYYNFIEVFGVQEAHANQIITKAIDLREQFRISGLKSTISPHAPYSVTQKLLKKLIENFDEEDHLLTIHIQETSKENELFENKTGDFFHWLRGANASPSIWEYRHKSTDILKELQGKNTLLVHNIFLQEESLSDNYYCTCPKANLYIENSLPNYSIFNSDKLCVGTDSLASNDSLSILEELEIIQKNSNFDLNTLLKIASKNGAEAFGFEQLGTFEKGKIPGVNLISGLSDLKIIA